MPEPVFQHAQVNRQIERPLPLPIVDGSQHLDERGVTAGIVEPRTDRVAEAVFGAQEERSPAQGAASRGPIAAATGPSREIYRDQ